MWVVQNRWDFNVTLDLRNSVDATLGFTVISTFLPWLGHQQCRTVLQRPFHFGVFWWWSKPFVWPDTIYLIGTWFISFLLSWRAGIFLSFSEKRNEKNVGELLQARLPVNLNIERLRLCVLESLKSEVFSVFSWANFLSASHCFFSFFSLQRVK